MKQIVAGIITIIASVLLAKFLVLLGETDITISAFGIIIGICCIFIKPNLSENIGK